MHMNPQRMRGAAVFSLCEISASPCKKAVTLAGVVVSGIPRASQANPFLADIRQRQQYYVTFKNNLDRLLQDAYIERAVTFND